MLVSVAFICGGGLGNLIDRNDLWICGGHVRLQVLPVFRFPGVQYSRYIHMHRMRPAAIWMLFFLRERERKSDGKTENGYQRGDCRRRKLERLSITEEMCGRRLDAVISAALDEYSRSFIQKLFESGNITVNGSVCREKKKKGCGRGDEIEIAIPEPKRTDVEPEDIPLHIVL